MGKEARSLDETAGAANQNLKPETGVFRMRAASATQVSGFRFPVSPLRSAP
jgi:hypothetical protein